MKVHTKKILLSFLLIYLYFFSCLFNNSFQKLYASSYSQNNKINAYNVFQIALTDLNEPYYSIQIMSLIDKKKAEQYIQKNIQKGFPVYLKCSKNNDRKIYRIRIGKFRKRVDAENFANYCQWEAPWIVKDFDESKKILINNVIIDDISFESATLYTYASLKKQLLIIYKKKYGIEMAVLPSDLILYMNNSKQKVIIENVTGFFETEESILFGKSIYLYRNPNGLPLNHFQDIYQKYVKKLNKPVIDIQNQCTVFEDGYDTHLTLLGTFDLKNKTSMIFDQAGFDYVVKNKKIQLKGLISIEQPLGNDQLHKVNIETMQSFKGYKLIAYTLKDSINNIKLCVLFY